MTSLEEYLLGQLVQTTRSIESEQAEQGEKLDTLTEKVDEALTWAQRLIWLGLAAFGAVGLNWSPEKIGEALALALKGIK